MAAAVPTDVTYQYAYVTANSPGMLPGTGTKYRDPLVPCTGITGSRGPQRFSS